MKSHCIAQQLSNRHLTWTGCQLSVLRQACAHDFILGTWGSAGLPHSSTLTVSHTAGLSGADIVVSTQQIWVPFEARQQVFERGPVTSAPRTQENSECPGSHPDMLIMADIAMEGCNPLYRVGDPRSNQTDRQCSSSSGSNSPPTPRSQPRLLPHLHDLRVVLVLDNIHGVGADVNDGRLHFGVLETSCQLGISHHLWKL